MVRMLPASSSVSPMDHCTASRPAARGLLLPVFNDEGRLLSQLDLSRAIEKAVEAGAHVINISGGQLTEVGEAEDWLDRAVRHAGNSGALIVAAAGNDGCACLHVPAALPTVLAVGAMDDEGRPLDFSNWGENYRFRECSPQARIFPARCLAEVLQNAAARASLHPLLPAWQRSCCRERCRLAGSRTPARCEGPSSKVWIPVIPNWSRIRAAV